MTHKSRCDGCCPPSHSSNIDDHFKIMFPNTNPSAPCHKADVAPLLWYLLTVNMLEMVFNRLSRSERFSSVCCSKITILQFLVSACPTNQWHTVIYSVVKATLPNFTAKVMFGEGIILNSYKLWSKLLLSKFKSYTFDLRLHAIQGACISWRWNSSMHTALPKNEVEVYGPLSFTSPLFKSQGTMSRVESSHLQWCCSLTTY